MCMLFQAVWMFFNIKFKRNKNLRCNTDIYGWISREINRWYKSNKSLNRVMIQQVVVSSWKIRVYLNSVYVVNVKFMDMYFLIEITWQAWERWLRKSCYIFRWQSVNFKIYIILRYPRKAFLLLLSLKINISMLREFIIIATASDILCLSLFSPPPRFNSSLASTCNTRITPSDEK